MIVEHDANRGPVRIVSVQALEQHDEFAAAMARLYVGDDFAGVQVQRGDDRQGTVANILVVAPDAGVLARNGWQVSSDSAQHLYAGLLVDTDGIDGLRTILMQRVRAVQIHVATDHQHIGHLALELWVAPFKVIAGLKTNDRRATQLCKYY